MNIQLGNDTVEGVVATESSFNANTDVVTSNEDDSSDAVSSEDNSQDILSWGNEHSFAEQPEMINQVNESDEITLEHDYSFMAGGSTITIDKALTINGNDHTLDDICLHIILSVKEYESPNPLILKNMSL